jgi:hypothetical protein
MLLEAALLPRNLSSHLLSIGYSYGSGSATLIFTAQKVQIQPSPLTEFRALICHTVEKKIRNQYNLSFLFCSVGDPDTLVIGTDPGPSLFS